VSALLIYAALAHRCAYDIVSTLIDRGVVQNIIQSVVNLCRCPDILDHAQADHKERKKPAKGDIDFWNDQMVSDMNLLNKQLRQQQQQQ
jgi:hypothetical protein